MKRTVTLTNAEVEIVVNYMNGERYCFRKENSKVPGKVAWAMFNNRKALSDAKSKMDEFKGEIDKDYINDERSYVTIENGEEVRKIKEDFVVKYNKELNELARQEVEISINTLSIEDLKDCNMDDIDYTMIGFMLEENSDYDEAEPVSVEVVEE